MKQGKDEPHQKTTLQDYILYILLGNDVYSPTITIKGTQIKKDED